MTTSLCVVIPTRNRPEKLRRCLEALATARHHLEFSCCVCDSSQTEQLQDDVRRVTADFDFVRHYYHSGNGVAAARNFGAQVADAELILTVDDDVYVTPDAIRILVNQYLQKTPGQAVFCGRVKFGSSYSVPVKMRRIGYGRGVEPHEIPDFIIGAFILYPKSLALQYPWNENLRTSEDRFMGSIWRIHKVEMHYVSAANAVHDEKLNTYDVTHQRSHIYANLFDAIFVRKSLYWFLCFEFIGFAAGAKTYFRDINSAFAYLKAWYLGHKDFIRDRNILRKMTGLPNQ